MRDTIVGTLLAIVFLGLLFAAPRYLPRGIEGMTRAEVAQIPAGFSGTKVIGRWTLVCSNAPVGAPPQSPQTEVGRCRMARGYRESNGQLVLAVAFRYAGPHKTLTMIVRFPPVSRQGQYLLFGLGKQGSLKLPVFGCDKTSCVAVGALIPAAQTLLLAAQQAQVLLPPRPDGKQYRIGIPLDGLGPALVGMHRAEL